MTACVSKAASNQRRDSPLPGLQVEKQTGGTSHSLHAPPGLPTAAHFLLPHVFQPPSHRLPRSTRKEIFLSAYDMLVSLCHPCNPYPSPVRWGLILPMLSMEKLSLREGKQLAQDHFIGRSGLATKLTLT